MARHHSRIGYIAIIATLVGSPALAEVRLPVPAVDQSAVAKRGFFYVGGHYVGEAGKHITSGRASSSNRLRPRNALLHRHVYC